jgi:hypothetical protein
MANTSDQTREITELRSQFAEYQQEIGDLKKVIQQIANANAVENILVNGFANVCAQLEPLRDISPQRRPLDQDQAARLRNLQDSLARPKWTGATTLHIEVKPVQFIGAIAPHVPQSIATQDLTQIGRITS